MWIHTSCQNLWAEDSGRRSRCAKEVRERDANEKEQNEERGLHTWVTAKASLHQSSRGTLQSEMAVSGLIRLILTSLILNVESRKTRTSIPPSSRVTRRCSNAGSKPKMMYSALLKLSIAAAPPKYCQLLIDAVPACVIVSVEGRLCCCPQAASDWFDRYRSVCVLFMISLAN